MGSKTTFYPRAYQEAATVKDLINRELAVGDVVAFNPPSYKGLTIGKIVKINPKMLRIAFRPSRGEMSETNVYPNDVAKLDGPEVTMYLLKQEQAKK